MKRGVWVFVLATVLMAVVAAAAQAKRFVTLSLDLPNGGHPTLTVEEGTLATVQLPNGGTFGFRPTVRDFAAGTLTVAIHSGATAESPLLAEVDVAVGAPAVRSGTTPSFGIAVTRLSQR